MRMFPINDGVPNFQFAQAITEMRLDELRKEAEQERMLDQADPARKTFLDGLMISVGSYLVSVGEKLRERHIPVTPQCSEACPSDF
jgi:hypothetical protein